MITKLAVLDLLGNRVQRADLLARLQPPCAWQVRCRPHPFCRHCLTIEQLSQDDEHDDNTEVTWGVFNAKHLDCDCTRTHAACLQRTSSGLILSRI